MSETAKARNGLSNNGSAIFVPITGQMRPSPANATIPVPTIAPVSAWVVETGRPVRDANRTQAIAPINTASVTAG